MIKVLVFGMSEVAGGVESVIMNYFRHMDSSKVHFDFLCNSESIAYEDEIACTDSKLYKLCARSKNAKKYYSDLKEFFSHHAKDYQAIWVNVCSLANIDYLIYAKKYGIPCRIIHSHNSSNMDSKIRGILHLINKRRITNYATDFWACSEIAGKWFYDEKIMKSDKYKIINNAIDVDKFRFNTQLRTEYRKKFNVEDKIVVGNIGRLHFEKNQEFAIDVFKEFHDIYPNSIFWIIGQGSDEQKLKDKVSNFGMNDCIQFLGSRKDIPSILQAMDILLFPSIFEGLPLVLIECQTADLLIFAAKDGIPEMINMNKKHFNFLALNQSAKEWASVMRKKYEDYTDRSDDNSCIIENGYSIENECKKMQLFFEEI